MTPDSTTPIVTFARRKKVQSEKEVTETFATKITAAVDNSQPGEEHPKPSIKDENRLSNGGGAARWRRMAAAKAKRLDDNTQVLTELKAYYDEVDSYDLAVETPTPPGKKAPAFNPHNRERLSSFMHPSKHMSLGLSRRSSVFGLGRDSTTSLAASPQRKSSAADEELPTKDTARRSSAAGVLSRLSMGMTGALSWLGVTGVSPIAEGEEPLSSPENADKEDCTAAPEMDLSAQLENLKIDESEHQGLDQASVFSQLLKLCGQEDEEASLPTMEALVDRYADVSTAKKIGEGTFGEAFRASDKILKIVPMDGDSLVNGEPQKRAEEILAETIVTLALTNLRQPRDNAEVQNVTTGFVNTFGVGVCRGRYAAKLVEEWHAWDLQFQSENEPVDVFEKDQLFVVFFIADAGVDLERFEVFNYNELRSILFQTTLTLAVAEEACNFEHRDLHWGNLMIKRNGADKIPFTLRGVDIEVEASGVEVTLIDFTLSRLQTESGDVAFCDLNTDPDLFGGPKGDYQAETYRRMKKAVKDDWRRFTPATNALWLWYLVDMFLTEKLPKEPYIKDEIRQLRGFRKQAATGKSAGDLVWNEFFDGIWV